MNKKRKLLDIARDKIRVKHYSLSTEKSKVFIERYNIKTV